jgi:hypothetical protein
MAPPDVVNRYFEADESRDIDAIVSLFSDDAVVVDEGLTWSGSAEIRAWQHGPASKWTYTTTVAGVEPMGEDRYRATGRLEGNFPGGTAELKWDFTLSGGFISHLKIAP